jgi:hypothetical protein
MNKQIRIGELQALAKTTDRPIDWAKRSWRQLVIDPNVLAVAAFCLIGFLLTLNFMLRFPDMGAVIAQYNQF